MRKHITEPRFNIWARISDEASCRLDRVRSDWGFKSRYEIIKYILYCFIRVADIDNAAFDEDLPPEEVIRIFDNLHETNRNFDFVKPSRRKGLTHEERKRIGIQSVKVKGYVTPKQYERLLRVKQVYGFASIYETLQYSIACFIRALDKPEPFEEDDEIDGMFDGLSDSERHFEYVKPKRAPSESKQKQALYS